MGQIRSTFTVEELSINNVAPDYFVLSPSPGELVFDRVAGRSYTYFPDTESRLDTSIREVMAEVEMHESDARTSRLIWLTIMAGLLVMGVLFTFRIVKRWRTK